MPNLTNATRKIRVYDKFEYHLCDLECEYCVNCLGRGVAGRCGSHGCGRSKCEFQDLRDECIAAGRIKRRRGWNKMGGE